MEEKKIYHVTFDMTDMSDTLNFHQKSKLIARQLTEHIAVKLIIIILILIDIGVLIGSTIRNDDMVLDYVAVAFSCIFLTEIFVRIYGLGFKTFFRNWINAVDFVIVTVTFIISLVSVIVNSYTPGKSNVAYFNFVTILRLLRLPRLLNIVRIISNKKNFLNASRYVTSENKRRFRLDGYDLDLCYITDRVIAMSFPSSGLAALYRNNILDVANFFNERYGSKYRIYNLCEERGYDTTIFNNQVERYMITDHNVPRLKEMIQFAESSRNWLSKDKKNVIAVHCKGGKGRTGTMICVHLVDSEVFDNAELCLQYFGERRTDLLQGKKFQGVETPSQNRYVGYFELIKKSSNYSIPEARKLQIEKIVIHGAQGLYQGDALDIWLRIIQGNAAETRETVLLERYPPEADKSQIKHNKNDSSKSVEISLIDSPILNEDIKIKFFTSNVTVPKKYDGCAFFFWFHTSFIDDNLLSLTRDQLDNPHKKSTWKIYGSDFKVEVFFKNVTS